jgi:hypothetical protein
MTTISAAGILYIRQPDFNNSVEYSTDNISWSQISPWPVTINNTDINTLLRVHFLTDIVLNNSSDFFICGTDNIQFGNTTLNLDGTRPKVIIRFVNDYPGLVRNGTSGENGKNDIAVVNIIVSSASSNIALNSGWVGQRYFSKGATNNIIVNCSSDGPISSSSGGIVGSNAIDNDGNLKIDNCSSSGSIGALAGGIIGPVDIDNQGSAIISNSFSTGTIGDNAGGICRGYVTAINCYSTGNITGAGGGGIFSSGIGKRAENCYSLGTISGASGGIIGQGGSGCIPINCYTNGDINNDNGGAGIFGRFSSITPTNCYTSGTLTGSPLNGGGIGSYSTSDGSTNYSEGNNGNSGSWDDGKAATTLQGVGTIWGSIATNTPYVLLNFGTSPYRLDAVDPTTYALNQTFSQTVEAGQLTIPAQVAGFKTFQILSGGDPSITIDNTGKITTSATTPPGTYTLMIYGVDDYTTTTFVLTVTGVPEPQTVTVPTATVTPCCQGPVCVQASPTTNKDNELITTYTSGQAIVSNVDRYYTDIRTGARTFFVEPVFKSYREYMNYLQTKNRYV